MRKSYDFSKGERGKFANRELRIVGASNCSCVDLKTRNEDFTLKSGLGQELTRNIELQVCSNCGERYIPGQTVSSMAAEIEAKVLALANERFEVPEGHKYFKYFDDVDLMVIKYSNNKTVKTEDDMSKGLICNYDYKGRIRSIEVLDFYGKFTDVRDE